MQRHFDQIAALSDIGQVLLYARDVSRECGAIRISYNITSAFDSSTPYTTAVYASGFSKELVAIYEKADVRGSDPIAMQVMQEGTMLSWADAMKSAPKTSANEAFFAVMREHGLIHGAGIPLFGPRGRDAYLSLDFGRPLIEVPPEAIGTVRSIAQAGHQRICVLLDQAAKIPRLSEREIEVLTWTARGKSTSSIATILDLSPETVKTYSKRIYSKLDVSDRVGAVVKALRMGLVRV